MGFIIQDGGSMDINKEQNLRLKEILWGEKSALK